MFQGVTGRLFGKAKPPLHEEPLKIKVKTLHKEQVTPVQDKPRASEHTTPREDDSSPRISQWFKADGSPAKINATFEADEKPFVSEVNPAIPMFEDFSAAAPNDTSDPRDPESSLDEMAALLQAAGSFEPVVTEKTVFQTVEDESVAAAKSPYERDGDQQDSQMPAYEVSPEIFPENVMENSVESELETASGPVQSAADEPELFPAHDTSHLDHLIAQALEEEFDKPDVRPETLLPPSTAEDVEIVFDFVSDSESDSGSEEYSASHSDVGTQHSTDITSIIDDHLDEVLRASVQEPAPPTEYHLDMDCHHLEQFTFNYPHSSEATASASDSFDELVSTISDSEMMESTAAKFPSEIEEQIANVQAEMPSTFVAEVIEAAPTFPPIDLSIIGSPAPLDATFNQEGSPVPSEALSKPQEPIEALVDEAPDTFESDLLELEAVNPSEETSEFEELDNISGTLEIFELPDLNIEEDTDSIQRIFEQCGQDPLREEVGEESYQAPEDASSSVSTSPYDEPSHQDSMHASAEAVTTTARQGIDSLIPEVNQQTADLPFRPPTTILITDVVIPTPNYALGAAYLWPMENSETETPAVESEESGTTSNVEQSRGDVPAEEIPVVPGEAEHIASPLTSLQDIIEPITGLRKIDEPIDYAEIGRGFIELRSSFSHGTEMTEVNLEGTQVLSPRDRERVLLLFSLAHESFDLLAEKPEYVNEVSTSEGREIENTTLVEQLVKIERHIDDTANAGLRSRGAGILRLDSPDAMSEAYFTVTEVTPAENAGVARRLAAFLVDFAVVVLVALFIVLSFESHDSMEKLWSLVTTGEISLTKEVITLLGVVIALLPFSVVLAGILYSLLRTTPGTWILGLQLTTPSGQPPAPIHLFVRTMFLPVTLVCFGWVPVIWGRAALHDFVARTKTMR